MVKKRTVPGKKGKEPSSSRKAARHRRSSYTLAIKQEVIGLHELKLEAERYYRVHEKEKKHGLDIR